MANGPFIDRFDFYPGDAKILEIEGIKVIDLSGPEPIAGAGTGVVGIVGEALKTGDYGETLLEDGTYTLLTDNRNKPTEVTNDQDFLDLVGAWSQWNNPGGPVSAGGVPEPGIDPGNYDGNLFLSMARRKFPRLVVCPIDQHCGTCTIVVTGVAGVVGIAGRIPAGVRVAIVGPNPTDIFATAVDILIKESDYTGDPPVATITGVPIRRVKGIDAAPIASQVLSPEDTTAFPGYTLSLTLFSAVADVNVYTNYTTAIDAFLDQESPSGDVDLLCLSRHPDAALGETLMKYAKTHAVNFAASGKGRIYIGSPPNATPIDEAASSGAADIGVGNVGRSDRMIYAYPGIKGYIPQLPNSYVERDNDGIITWPFDTCVASICAALPPEENPGQLTNVLDWLSGLERVPPTAAGNPRALMKSDYTSFRSIWGIAAPKRFGASFVIQSGVNSMDPAVYPVKRNIKRRRFADFWQESVTTAVGPLLKKLGRDTLKDAILSMIVEFNEGLLSPDQPELQRIHSYSVDGDKYNTEAKLEQGIWIVECKVKLLPSLDAIVFITEIGETVQITAS